MSETVNQRLTSNFFDAFATFYNVEYYGDIYAFISGNSEYLAAYALFAYDKLELMDLTEDYTDIELAQIAFTTMGHAFAKIYRSLYAVYDPLENYFTDRTYEEDGDGSLEKKGTETTTPSGTMSVTSNGTKTNGFNLRQDTGQATTYDNASTFKDVERHKYEGDTTEGFNNYGTSTSYNNYHVDNTFTNRVDETEAHKEGEEHRKGNSGIFSKQDLTQREINLRLKNKVVPILVRMIVDVFNKGVWSE